MSQAAALPDVIREFERTPADIVRQAGPYFRDDIEYDADAVAKQWKDAAGVGELFRDVRQTLASLERWEPGAMEEALRALAERRNVAGGKVFQPLRVALTGLTVSPGIFDVLLMLGRERALARLDVALRYLGGAR